METSPQNLSSTEIAHTTPDEIRQRIAERAATVSPIRTYLDGLTKRMHPEVQLPGVEE